MAIVIEVVVVVRVGEVERLRWSRESLVDAVMETRRAQDGQLICLTGTKSSESKSQICSQDLMSRRVTKLPGASEP